MKDMKFRVESPKHSEAIQKELFRLGFRWYNKSKTISLTSCNFLFAQAHCYRISWDPDESYFIKDEAIETTIEQLKQMEI